MLKEKINAYLCWTDKLAIEAMECAGQYNLLGMFWRMPFVMVGTLCLQVRKRFFPKEAKGE